MMSILIITTMREIRREENRTEGGRGTNGAEIKISGGERETGTAKDARETVVLAAQKNEARDLPEQ
jgi:hypothetical protein